MHLYGNRQINFNGFCCVLCFGAVIFCGFSFCLLLFFFFFVLGCLGVLFFLDGESKVEMCWKVNKKERSFLCSFCKFLGCVSCQIFSLWKTEIRYCRY